MASKSVETIFFGFWKNYASHVDNIISPHKRKNILFACLHLTSAVLNLVKCDVGSSESIEMAGEVLKYLILICSIKKADFIVKVVSENSQDAVTRSDLLELLNDITFIGNCHQVNPEKFGDQDYVCSKGYNLILQRTIQKFLSALPSYTNKSLRFLAVNEQANSDIEGFFRDRESGNPELDI